MMALGGSTKVNAFRSISLSLLSGEVPVAAALLGDMSHLRGVFRGLGGRGRGMAVNMGSFKEFRGKPARGRGRTVRLWDTFAHCWSSALFGMNPLRSAALVVSASLLVMAGTVKSSVAKIKNGPTALNF